MATLFGGIVSLVLSVILITSVVVPTIKNTNTSTWDVGEIAVFGLVSLISIFGLAYSAAALFGMV